MRRFQSVFSPWDERGCAITASAPEAIVAHAPPPSAGAPAAPPPPGDGGGRMQVSADGRMEREKERGATLYSHRERGRREGESGRDGRRTEVLGGGAANAKTHLQCYFTGH